MTVARNHTTCVKSGPEVVGDGLIAEVVANGLLHLGEPVQDFLVGQSVERSSQAVETGSKGQHRRAQSTANQVGSVRAHVATLVVRVDCKVQAHELDKVGVVTITKLVRQVEGVVLVFLDGGHLAILVGIAVDLRGDGGQLGDQVHRVLEGVGPVFLLADALGVGFGEFRSVFQGGNGNGELSHGVHVVGASVNELLDEFGEIRSRSPVGGQISDLLLAGNLASQEQPEQPLRQWLLATRSLWQDFLAFRDRSSTESDALLRVKDGTFPDQ